MMVRTKEPQTTPKKFHRTNHAAPIRRTNRPSQRGIKGTPGAPTTFRPEYIDKAYRMSLLALTMDQLAGVFDTDISVLYQWKKRHPEFAEAITRGKEEADAKVVKRLFQRAVGYEYEETTYEKTTMIGVDGDKVPAVRTKTVVKQALPDTTAQIFWLKNRRPTQWRDRHQTEVTGEGGGAIKQEVKVLSLDDLRPAVEALISCGAVHINPN